MSAEADPRFYRLDLHARSADEWTAQAERFDKMAQRLKLKPELSSRFRQLARDARARAKERQTVDADASGHNGR